MRTLGDFFLLALATLIGGVLCVTVAYAWGDKVDFLEQGKPYYVALATIGFLASCFIGLELLRRRF